MAGSLTPLRSNYFGAPFQLGCFIPSISRLTNWESDLINSGTNLFDNKTDCSAIRKRRRKKIASLSLSLSLSPAPLPPSPPSTYNLGNFCSKPDLASASVTLSSDSPVCYDRVSDSAAAKTMKYPPIAKVDEDLISSSIDQPFRLWCWNDWKRVGRECESGSWRAGRRCWSASLLL